MEKNQFLETINYVMGEQIASYKNAKRNLRYAIESAIISLMGDENVIQFDTDNKIFSLDEKEIISVLKLKDADNDDFIAFEVANENENGDIEKDVKAIYRFDIETIIAVWKLILEINGIEDFSF